MDVHLMTFGLLTLIVGSQMISSEEVLHRHRRQADDTCEVADLVFVLDSSGSIGIENWARVLNFTRGIVSAFPIGSDLVQVGVNYYGNDAILAFNLADYDNVDDVNTAISAIPWLNQNTNTSGGIRLMYRDMFKSQSGARPGVPRIGIVITDGESTFDKLLTIPEANNAREEGIILFAIGIGNATSQVELIGIANEPADQFVFNADSFEALGAIQEEIVATTCTVVAECSESADWVFILDGSGSVGSRNFRQMVDFQRNLTLQARVDEGDARVGLMVFSDFADISWNLNSYSTRREMVDALDVLKYIGGTTNTAAALRVARTNMFTTANGDRDDRGNVIVLFTDGGSNNFEETMEEARLTRLAGIEILVVAVSGWVNEIEVYEIASDPDTYSVFTVTSFKDLFSIFEDLKSAVCNDGNMCRDRPCQNGGECVKQYGDYTCICPQGFAGKNCDIVCPNLADVVLVLDGSSSMGRCNYYELQEYAKTFVRNLNIDMANVGLVTFGDSAVKRFDLNYANDIMTLVDSISYPFTSSKTNSADAMKMLRESFTFSNGDDPTVRNIAVFFTDGQSSDRLAAFEEAAKTHTANIEIIAVGVDVKGKYAREELRSFASDPDEENFLEVANTDELYDVTQRLVRTVCNDVNECLSNPCFAGSTCVDMLNGFECLCAEGRSGRLCQRACSGGVDLIFAIDASGSIRQERFETVLEFAANVANQLDVREGRAHVGALTFGDDAVMSFPLGKYTTKQDVMHALKTIQYTRGRTNIADALRMAHEIMFTEANGDRPEVPNVLFVITDGESTVNRNTTIPQAIAARLKGIRIMIGSVEISTDSLEMKAIANRPPKSHIFGVNRFSEMDDIVEQLSMSFCNDVDECLSNPCVTGQCINRLHRHFCQCPDDRTGFFCERVCTTSMDLAFVLDASGSVDYDYELAQDIARHLLVGLNFNQDRSRVSIVTYQTVPTLRFFLNTYSTRAQLANVIGYDNDMGIIGTNTAQALRLVQNTVFTFANGDRSGVENVMIVITDGRSNIEQSQTRVEADRARTQGIRVIAIGLGTNVNQAEVEAIADAPAAGNAFYIQDITQKDSVIDDILDTLCA